MGDKDYKDMLKTPKAVGRSSASPRWATATLPPSVADYLSCERSSKPRTRLAKTGWLIGF